MNDAITIVRIAGDGVGAELVAAGSRLVESSGIKVDWVDAEAGYGAYERHGHPVPPRTLALIREHGAAIKGPFHTPNGGSVRSANHYLRRDLDLYACLRPLPYAQDREPVLLVRENVEDLYGAIEWQPTPHVAQAVKVATRSGCERIARFAVAVARTHGRSKITAVHKANNLKLTEGMFLEIAESIVRQEPGLEFDEILADTAAANLVLAPECFDVLLTSNTFGDLLSSVGAAASGSVGLVGSLNSGDGRHIAEAAHGDAADLAGQDRVNPLAFFASIQLLLGALGFEREAHVVDVALREVRSHGPATLDLGGTARTSHVTKWVCDHVANDVERGQ
jgi:isocitrate dehydrogenase (NAD+)